ncbi:hypothetical protein AGMMS4956_17410 [Bacteroidia bacterium]|nr:hypothetical protein AGMMS4956_17410 [Bacteroidia bacterium]
MPSCEVDERGNDLTGGYRGAFIDKNTGDTIATEYYGAKIRLLDINYGAAAQALTYNALPNGTFQNTKVYPSRYKVWGEGPFLRLDTLYGAIQNMKELLLTAIPNLTVKIDKVEIRSGVIVDVTFSYTVNDMDSRRQEVGIVYGTTRFPGQTNAQSEGTPNASTYKRIITVDNAAGELTETFYLDINSTYYFRALGRTASAGDYWNYSQQSVVNTGDIELDEIPAVPIVGARSASSAVIQWSLPSFVDKIQLTYTDKDGVEVVDLFSPNSLCYVANLPDNQVSNITVNLISKGNTSADQSFTVQTKALSAQYIEPDAQRADGIPFFYDVNMKYSLSVLQADTQGALGGDAGWVGVSYNHEFFDWWNTGGLAAFNWAFLPTSANMADFETLEISGGIKNIVDLLPCENLKHLTISQGVQFSAGEVIATTTDLSVLSKLKKLETITIGIGVPLTEDMLRNAGVGAAVVITKL